MGYIHLVPSRSPLLLEITVCEQIKSTVKLAAFFEK